MADASPDKDTGASVAHKKHSPMVQALITVIVCIIIAFIGGILWYHLGPGWKQFTFYEGDYASWTPDSGKPVGGLRFRDVKFTITPSGANGMPSGAMAAPVTTDVTPVLNRMARAFTAVGVNTNLPALAIVRPLNAFSFAVSGLTDVANQTAFMAANTTSTTMPTCSAESACMPDTTGATNGVFPTGWAHTPIPGPPGVFNPDVNPSGTTVPDNWLCYIQPSGVSSGCEQLPSTATSAPVTTTCGVTYPTPGTCFRTASAPTTELTGYYRSFKI